MDEVSFNDARIFGHLDHRLRLLTNNPNAPFGGLAVLLGGDMFQKPPPRFEPWHKPLVADALAARAAAGTAEGQGGRWFADARGLEVLRTARRFKLWRNMRAAGDPAFAAMLTSLRRTDVPLPVADVSWLRELSADDLRAEGGEAWRFAPIAVLSRRERDALNVAQAHAFARAFNLPLIRWRLDLGSKDISACIAAHVRDELYESEEGLWGYFVEGAPAHMTDAIRSTRKLVNGTPCLLDSLTFRGGLVP